MKKKIAILSLLVAGMGWLVSCKEDTATPEDPTPQPTEKAKYVFVAYSVGSQGVESAPYIITADSLTGGKVNLSNGVETDAYSFVTQNNTIFAAVWGGQGPITPFKLNSQGKIAQAGNTVNAVTAAIYGNVGTDSWIGGGFTGSPSDPIATLFRFDAKNLILGGRNTIDMSKFAMGGEWPTWYGVFPFGSNNVLIPYDLFPSDNNLTQTKYPDSTWVMLVSYPDLQYKKVIRDGRTGPIGTWFGMQGLSQTTSGDVYGWSTAVNSKNPSAIIRIKKDTDVFDQSYFFNLEQKSGGLKVSRGEYISGNKFLMSFFINQKEVTEWTGRTKLAVVDVVNQTITWVTGVPEHAQMGYKQKILVEKDGNTVHYVMKGDDGKHVVYNINATTAVGKKGLEFEGVDDITTISKLSYE